MGCLRKAGCLLLVVIVVLIAWFTRVEWLPRVTGGGKRAAERGVGTGSAATWQPLTEQGVQRARSALRQLSGRSGPVFVNVAPGDLAAYIFQEMSKTLPSSADSVEAGAFGEQLFVRARVNTKDLKDTGALGPLAMLLGEREPVELAGTLQIIRPGLAELRVREIKIRDLSLPSPLIPRILRQIAPPRGERPAELSPDGIALQTPDYIGDVRVANGRITLYKTLQ